MELPEPSLQLEYVREPLLGFAFGQRCEHPKDGLYLYGPVAGRSGAAVTVGVIGTEEGVEYFRTHLTFITKYAEAEPPKKTERKTGLISAISQALKKLSEFLSIQRLSSCE